MGYPVCPRCGSQDTEGVSLSDKRVCLDCNKRFEP